MCPRPTPGSSPIPQYPLHTITHPIPPAAVSCNSRLPSLPGSTSSAIAQGHMPFGQGTIAVNVRIEQSRFPKPRAPDLVQPGRNSWGPGWSPQPRNKTCSSLARGHIKHLPQSRICRSALLLCGRSCHTTTSSHLLWIRERRSGMKGCLEQREKGYMPTLPSPESSPQNVNPDFQITSQLLHRTMSAPPRSYNADNRMLNDAPISTAESASSTSTASTNTTTHLGQEICSMAKVRPCRLVANHHYCTSLPWVFFVFYRRMPALPSPQPGLPACLRRHVNSSF
ncbi:hypothetical protein EDC01DRAFT_123067 [Geopyxis carbonaria]|nr:hypothetical protein EDC01DRAFT_123067 [Geopyxis carbonaria]